MDKDKVYQGKLRDLGGFTVVRSLPHAQQRQVGPFVFLDHMGPLKVDSTHFLNVRPHPHIGLATVTYLFTGRGHHRDNIGYSQVIEPGDLNWMTAGKGIVHSERTPESEKTPPGAHSIHGVQIWVALPVEFEDCQPSFKHYSKDVLPRFAMSEKLNAVLMIGEWNSQKSPVETHSRMLLMELRSKDQAGQENIKIQEKEAAIFLIEGTCRVNGQELKENDLIFLDDPANTDIEYGANTLLVLVGGEPFEEPRYMWWNFVSSDKNKIRTAIKKWENQEYDIVPGETDFTPLPAMPQP